MTIDNNCINLNLLLLVQITISFSDALGSLSDENLDYSCKGKKKKLKSWRLPRNSEKFQFSTYTSKMEKRKAFESSILSLHQRQTDEHGPASAGRNRTLVCVFMWHFRGFFFVLVINCYRMDLTSNLAVTAGE